MPPPPRRALEAVDENTGLDAWAAKALDGLALTPTPAVQQYVMPAAAAVQPSVSAQSLIFPTANLLAEGGTSIVTSFDDELDKMAAIQSQKDAQIDAYRAQQRAKQEAEGAITLRTPASAKGGA